MDHVRTARALKIQTLLNLAWARLRAPEKRWCAMLSRFRAAGLLVRVNASDQPLLYRAAHNQQDDGEDDCYSQDLPGAKTTQHPNRCSRPDRCRGGEALDLNTCRTMQDHTRTEETDPRNDTLDHPASIGSRILRHRQHGNG